MTKGKASSLPFFVCPLHRSQGAAPSIVESGFLDLFGIDVDIDMDKEAS
jgi:hypothetical protein